MEITKHKLMHSLLITILVLAEISQVESVEPISLFIATTVSLSTAGYYLRCKVTECCTTDWMTPNITGLRDAIQQKVHGQHLVLDTVVKSLKGHLYDPDPAKALVLSFHGWTGGGKNFVSHFIANHLYYHGTSSKYVHLFVSTLHFPHKSKLHEYQHDLSAWIRGNVTECERSLFIFDEMDKLPTGLIDTIKPFVDHHKNIEGTNYRKSIFLFLSNTAGNDITKKTLEHWRNGKTREEITLKDMEEIIQLQAFNEQGGLWRTELLHKNLVNAFIPFLPMERQHVRLCIEDDLRAKNHSVTTAIVDKVADELQYFPADVKLFSKTGCKRVSEKVNFVMETV